MLIIAEEVFHKVPFPINILICLGGFSLTWLARKLGVMTGKNFDGTVMGFGLMLIIYSQNHFNIPSAVGFLLLMWGCSESPVKKVWLVAGVVMVFIGVSACEFWQWGQ